MSERAGHAQSILAKIEGFRLIDESPVDALERIGNLLDALSEDEEMSEETNWYEWGYRLSGGEEVWEIDHGTDGSWTPARPDLNMSNVDIYSGNEYGALRRALDQAGLTDSVVTRRRVSETRDGTEVVTE